MHTDACVVYVTTSSPEEAARLAQVLVNERLAACVQQVGPIQSTYIWQEQLCEDQEYLLIIKTRSALTAALTERVQALHSYDVPEVLVLPVQGGSVPYLQWLYDQTQEPEHV